MTSIGIIIELLLITLLLLNESTITCHFNYTNYYLFNVNCTGFNEIYSPVSEIWKFENSQFESQAASRRRGEIFTIFNRNSWSSDKRDP